MSSFLRSDKWCIKLLCPHLSDFSSLSSQQNDQDLSLAGESLLFPHVCLGLISIESHLMFDLIFHKIR